MRLPFWSWDNTFRKLGFKRVGRVCETHRGSARVSGPRTFHPQVETLEARAMLTLNTPPIVVDHTYDATEDVALVSGPAGVLTGASDADGHALAAVLVNGPAHGTLTLNANGSFRYRPDAGYSGTDSFVYQARDPFALSSPATVTIDVAPVNDAPLATDDVFSLAEDGTLDSLTSVLDSDTDPEADALTAELLAGPVNGTLTLNPSGMVSYVPNPDFAGDDWFTYRALDAGGAASEPATVTISVTPVNDAPIAASDVSYETNEETPLTIESEGVLLNDSDVDFDPLSATLIEDVAHGTLSLAADGSFSYMPAPGFSGTDSFSYEVSDGAGGTSTAVVTITVHPVNDAPIAADDDYATDEDTPLTVPVELGVLANDTDPDGDPLTATLVSPPANGSVELSPDGSFTYTPALNFHGHDSFTYQVSDGTLDSNVATVTIAVNPVNDAPVATDNAASTDEDTAITIDVLTGDTDVESDTLSIAEIGPASNGTTVLNSDSSITYIPNLNFYGEDSFTYTIGDGNGGSATATVTITVNSVFDPVVPHDDEYTFDEDGTMNLAAAGVLTNDDNLEGGILIAVLDSFPASGALTLSEDGGLVYVPEPNFSGSVSFTYRVFSAGHLSETATVTLNVSAVNDAPVGVDDAEYSTAEDTPLSIPALGVLANDTDADSDPLTAILVSGTMHGTLVLDPTGGFVYTPDANYYGTDSFTYLASDGSLESSPVTVTIAVSPVNDSPVAVNDSASTTEDVPVTIDVLTNDTDLDGDPLTPVIVAEPSYGTATVNSDGTITYIPNADSHGSDSFSYVVNDGTADSNVATVFISITTAGDAPIAVNDGTFTTEMEVRLTVNSVEGVLANDTDSDGDTLTAILVADANHGKVILNANGSFTYTPNNTFHGTDTFTYKATDGDDYSNIATVTITVFGIPEISIYGGAVLSEEGEESTTITVKRTGGDINTSLSVPLYHAVSGTLPATGTDPEPGSEEDYTLSTGYSVTFDPGQDTVTLTLTATDDALVEQNQMFQLWIENSVAPFGEKPAYTRDVYHTKIDFTILDDEWRWTQPSGPEADGWWEWTEENGEEIHVNVERTLFPDGTLSPTAYVNTPSWSSVHSHLFSNLVFPGFPNNWYYSVDMDATFAFAGNSQTGQIWVDGTAYSPPTGVANDGGYLGGGIEYSWAIDDDTGTDIHTVTVQLTFQLIAGGTYGWGTTGGASGKGASGNVSLSTSESWKTEYSGGRSVTLFFRKGSG